MPQGVTNYRHFVASTSAMIGMPNAMARELASDGINVRCIRPAGVATKVDRAVNQTVDLRKTRIAPQCIKRGMEQPEIFWDLWCSGCSPLGLSMQVRLLPATVVKRIVPDTLWKGS